MKRLLLTIAVFAIMAPAFAAQTNDFTYQGTLNLSGSPANGNYDFEFRLFDAADGGAQVGPTVTRSGVSVASGVFNVSLSFAGAFPGADRWMEIAVRQAGSGGGYQQLLPRVKVNSSPYSIKSQTADTAANATNAVNATNATNATTANNALNLGGIAANQYIQTTDARLSDARPPTAGSTNYVQNTSVMQPNSSFYVSGDSRVGGIFRAERITTFSDFYVSGFRVLSTPSNGNTYVGRDTAASQTTGNHDTFVGENAGQSNTTGSDNSFVGYNAGWQNTTGGNNSYFGSEAGYFSSTGSHNSFFGYQAGWSNTNGHSNSIFGSAAGRGLTTGFNNTFIGRDAGRFSTAGSSNTFTGSGSGDSNTIGNSNTFYGAASGGSNLGGSDNVFVGVFAGNGNTSGERNVFLGYSAGSSNLTGSSNTMIGYNAEVLSPDLQFATVIGAGAAASTSNSVVLGRSADTVRIPGNLNLTGAASVNGNLVVAAGNLSVLNGNVVIPTLGSAGATALCRNASNFLATCSSSLRYKTNISPFASGLDLIRRLQPITFDWKDGGLNDLGLGAEDVAAIEPLLVTYNKDGQVEGVKYDRIGVVLVNAVKEQQRQIDDQRKEINALRSALCTLSPQLAVCNSQENK